MKDLTRRPARGSVPWGLIGAVALVAAAERLVVEGNLNATSDHAVIWRQADRMARRMSPGPEVLCFGDSQVKMGVVPRAIRQETGQGAYNLAVLGGSAETTYYLFRRALEAGARPRAVVVNFSLGFLKESPSSSMSRHPWSEILTAPEAFELAREARDGSLFGQTVLCRYLPTLRGRFEVRAYVLSCLKGTSTAAPRDHRRALAENGLRNDGAEVFPANPAQTDPGPAPGASRQPGTWSPDPVNARYVKKFMDLAAARRVRLYWVLPPMTAGAQSWVEWSGDEERFLRFVRQVQARYPGLVVVDGRHTGLAATRFYDPNHLGLEGAVAFSRALGRVLRDAPPPGWVTLPPDDGRPPDVVGVEDVARTKLVLQPTAGRVVR